MLNETMELCLRSNPLTPEIEEQQEYKGDDVIGRFEFAVRKVPID